MDFTFTGKFTSAAGAIEAITTGCDSCYIKVVNVTTNVIYEYYNDGTNYMGTATAGATGVITQADATIINNSRGFSVAAAALSTDNVVYYTARRL